MKKKSPPYAFIGAVVLGAIAVYLFFQYKQAEDKKATAAAEQVRQQMQAQLDASNANKVTVAPTSTNMRPVLFATKPVEAGTRISAAFYEKKLTPNDLLPDAYTGDSDIVGWFAVRKIEVGDPLTPRNVGKSLPYMSQRISPGMRALSLKVFNAASNYTGGFIVDGDKVDLLYSLTSDNDLAINTQLVMQNLPVLYVPGPAIKTDKTDGITPIPSPGDAVAVTFEVTPEQAQALIFMSQVKEGRFSMILRARKDDSEIKIKPFDVRDYDWLKLTKVQKTVDKSMNRVKELAAEIEAKEKAQGTQGTANETTAPTPPTP